GGGLRAVAAATALDGKIYAMGGNNGNTAVGTTQVFNPSTGKWTAVSPLQTIREDHGAAAGHDGLIYAIGGRNGNDNSLNTVEVYHSQTGTWSFVNPMSVKRFGPGVAVGP